MVPHMKANIFKVKSTDTGNLPGLIKALTLESFMTTIFMDKVFMNGLMEEFLMEIGEIIKWRVMDVSHGQMEENMLDLYRDWETS